MRGKENVAGESAQALVDSLNGLHVQMVRRLVEQQHVRARKHHAREHAPDLLAAGQHVHRLEDLFAGDSVDPVSYGAL